MLSFYLFGTRMGIEWEKSDHFLIRKFVSISALNNSIQNENFPMVFAERHFRGYVLVDHIFPNLR